MAQTVCRLSDTPEGIVKVQWKICVVFIGLMFVSQYADACTSFVLERDGTLLFGANYDNEIMPGMLCLNRKNVRKSGWEAGTSGDIAKWVSRYGSVTFNVAGYQLPWAGMNEKGLVMSTLALVETQNPAPDPRPPLQSVFWMQYILDTCATVDELIATDKVVRIKDTVDHYLVCDAQGHAAVIEFLKGKMTVHRGHALPYKVLVNRLYSQAAAETQTGSSNDATVSRFIRVAKLLGAYQPKENVSAQDYAFKVLDTVGCPPYTRWSLVFDIPSRTIRFKTCDNRNIRLVDLNKIDFSCQESIRVQDIHAKLRGDISGAFREMDRVQAVNHLIQFLKASEIEMPQEQVRELFLLLVNFTCDRDVHSPDTTATKGGVH